MDWSRFYPEFQEHEFRCRQTGRVAMEESTIERLYLVRQILQKPMVVSSGYRHTSHPAERHKGRPGAHVYGHAADIRASGTGALELLYASVLAAACEAKLLDIHEARVWLPHLLKHGFTGVGVQQAAGVQHASRFIHFDDIPADVARPRPWLWSY